MNAGEVCDDGNLADGDGCDSNCTASACGNGIVTGAEGCDDGNTVSCDGCAADCSAPEAVHTWYADADGDTFGDLATGMLAYCQPAGHVSDGTDCDDLDAATHPAAPETCGDGIDNDCQGGDLLCIDLPQGIATVGSLSTTAGDLRAMPVTVGEAGVLTGVSMYHEGAGYDDATVGSTSSCCGTTFSASVLVFTFAEVPTSGTLTELSVKYDPDYNGPPPAGAEIRLGIYSGGPGGPGAKLAQTGLMAHSTGTAVTTSTGDLETPLDVTAGQTVWLASLFEDGDVLRKSYAHTSESPAPQGWSYYRNYSWNNGVLPATGMGSPGTLYGSKYSMRSRYVIGGVPQGDMVLAVYDSNGDAPGQLLGATPPAVTSTETGWQTIELGSPVPVGADQTVWLAWLYEHNPGLFYEVGTPGGYSGGGSWSGLGGAMPGTFPPGSPTDHVYSIYALAAPVCGDGGLAGTELCDDGNLTDGDGCDSNCTPTGCGNDVTTAGEECDGEGCCAADCRLLAAGTLCRDVAHDCDTADHCDGLAPACADATVADGTACAGGVCELGVCNGLVVSYDFEEGSGTSTVDLSGRGHTGHIAQYDPAEWVAGVSGGTALHFADRSDHEVEAWSAPDLDVVDSFAIQAWIRRTDDGTIVSRERGRSSGAQYRLLVSHDDLELELDGERLHTAAVVPAGEWTHVAATWDGAVARYYVDGQQRYAQAFAGPLATSNQPLVVGSYWYGGQIGGAIDRVQLWDAARHPSFICHDAGGSWDGASCAANRFCGDGRAIAGEQCDDGNADDCDGCSAACVAEPPSTLYHDGDSDAWGDTTSATVFHCPAPPGWIPTGGDCNDADPAVHPAAVEVCGDGVDNDCADGDPACGVCGNLEVEWGEECDGGACCGPDCYFSAAGTECDPFHGTLCTGSSPSCATTMPDGVQSFTEVCP